MRGRVLFTVNLNGGFQVICKPGMTLNGLDFSLGNVQRKQAVDKQNIILKSQETCVKYYNLRTKKGIYFVKIVAINAI